MGEKVCIYARVSTDDQADKQTIDIQLRDCRRWAEREGHAVAAEFSDEGVSGATPFDERPAGASLLARADEFDKVVFYSVDRMARDTVEGGLAMKALERAGIAVVFVTIQLDLETPEGVMILDQMLSFAKYERAVIARRTTKGRQASARRGNWPGWKAPYGYRKVDRRLRVRLSEARVLRRMVRMVLDDGMGSTAIASRFNGRVRPPDGAKQWWASSINHFLRKPYYPTSACPEGCPGIRRGRPDTGVRHAHTEYAGQKVPCPVLIRPDERRRIARVFSERKERSPRRTVAFHLLQHLVFCRECVGMYYSNMIRNKDVYYCGTRRQGVVNGHGGVERWWWKAPELETEVKRKVLSFMLSPAETIRRSEAYVERPQAGDGAGREIAGLRDELAALAGERDRVLSQNQKGYLSEAEMDVAMAGVATSREKAAKRLEELEEAAAVVDPDEMEWLADLEDQDFYHELLADLYKAKGAVDDVLDCEGYDPRDWRELIESIVERAWVENDGTVSVVFAGSAS